MELQIEIYKNILAENPCPFRINTYISDLSVIQIGTPQSFSELQKWHTKAPPLQLLLLKNVKTLSNMLYIGSTVSITTPPKTTTKTITQVTSQAATTGKQKLNFNILLVQYYSVYYYYYYYNNNNNNNYYYH